MKIPIYSILYTEKTSALRKRTRQNRSPEQYPSDEPEKEKLDKYAAVRRGA